MSSSSPPLLANSPPPLLPKRRYHDLDALRAFAMLLGIVLHGLLSFMPNSGWPGQDINQSAAYGFGLNAIHGFRMPLFFLVSGFFTTMMWRGRGLDGLLKHRTERVLLPLVVFGVVLVPVTMAVAIFGGIQNEQMSLAGEGATTQVYAESEEVEEAPLLPKLPGLGPIIEQLPVWVMLVVVLLCLSPVFHHLWFLYYLLWLVLGFMLVVSCTEKLKLRSVPGWFVASPYRLLWLLPAAFVPQFFMTMAFGADTAAGIVPWPPKLLYYAVFFGFGAMCFGQKDFDEKVGRWWPVCLALAVPALLLALHWFELRGAAYAAGHAGDKDEFMMSHVLCTAFTVLYTWLMVFGLIGFFRSYFSGEHPRVRYISDSSYWLYLMHLPLIMFLQICVSGWPYPSFVKFIGICVVTAGVLLLLYEYMVRYTWIGTMLNGKKTRTRIPGQLQNTPPPALQG